MICILDHQDSFTYNIFAYVKKIGFEAVVLSTDSTTINDIKKINPKAFVLSPGPGHPSEASLFLETLRVFQNEKPFLGVCLGHQAIAHYFGARIRSAHQIVHGNAVMIRHKQNSQLFKGVPIEFQAMRYNSLTVDNSLPNTLIATCCDDQNEVMGLRHTELAIEGVQFHPESVGTPLGLKIITNFLESI